MTGAIAAHMLRDWLYDGTELALLDVREDGRIAEGHILFSAPLPYSRFETGLPRLVPNRDVRMVLCDDGDAVAARAAARAQAIGYGNVSCLEGGVASWAAAGHTLYRGVNVPSKAFGELVEHAWRTPHLTPAELARMQAESADMAIVDGRTPGEFARMSIPGARFCPNGELALRIDGLAPSPSTTVIVNCAGRTRSIIGAQTLIDLGIPNPVYALENGTQGWTLAGFDLGHGADPGLPGAAADLEDRRRRAGALADRHGVTTASPATLDAWLRDESRTVYLLDVRTDEERAADPAGTRDAMARHGVVDAPGGQLVQATDRWIGVRRARLVVLDDEGVRAPVTAAWLRRMGHEACVLDGGLAALGDVSPRAEISAPTLPGLPGIAPGALDALRRQGGATILDLRASAAYRAGHVPGATWTIRPRIGRAAGAGPHVLVAETPEAAALAALDLAEALQGASRMSQGGQAPDGAARSDGPDRSPPDIRLLDGGFAAWAAAGLPVEATPDRPPDPERIDFVAFTHGRHEGDAEASRQYLAWEIGLVDQLDPQERAVFRV